jgi:hypothetical protein
MSLSQAKRLTTLLSTIGQEQETDTHKAEDHHRPGRGRGRSLIETRRALSTQHSQGTKRDLPSLSDAAMVGEDETS